MSDGSDRDAGGAVLPGSFGEKLSYMAPVLATTLVVAVLISFLLLWVVKGNLQDQIKNTEDKLGNIIGVLKQELAEAKRPTMNCSAGPRSWKRKARSWRKRRPSSSPT